MKTVFTIFFVSFFFVLSGQVSHYDYALLSLHVYNNEEMTDISLEGTDWLEYLRSDFNDDEETDDEGYFGIAYLNTENFKEVVIAHRGTDAIDDLITDGRQLADNLIPEQFPVAKTFIDRVRSSFLDQFGLYPILTFTGHSLGGNLAELSSCFYGYDAVVFESPGAQSIIDQDLLRLEIEYNCGNVTVYNAAPNIVNSANSSVGSLVYRVYPLYLFDATRDPDPDFYDFGDFTTQQHNMRGILNQFNPNSGFPYQYGIPNSTLQINISDLINQVISEVRGVNFDAITLSGIYTGRFYFNNYMMNPYYWNQYFAVYGMTEMEINQFIREHLTRLIPIVRAEGDIIVGDETNNFVFGSTEFADRISTGKGQDQILANGGDDIINSGPGYDIIHGGMGEDVYQFSYDKYNWNTIEDEDGGEILIADIQLKGIAVKIEERKYLLDHQGDKFELQTSALNNGITNLYIYKPGLNINVANPFTDDDVIEILDYENGDFDIYLEEEPITIEIIGEDLYLICPNISYAPQDLMVKIEDNTGCENCNYEIEWSTGEDTETISITQTGTYEVTVTYEGFEPVSESKTVLFQPIDNCNECQPGDECWGNRGIGSYDPNEILGPLGVGEEKWVSVAEELPYTIYFENSPDFATAPAQTVRIEHDFDDNINPYSMRLGSFGFGDFNFEVPENTSYYSNQLDLRDSLGIYVNVVAGINAQEAKAFWVLESVDPETGLNSTLGAFDGFLPVNDSITRSGEGYVSFWVKSLSNSTTGDTIVANANIFFDDNPPIVTNTTYNTIDASRPQSDIVEVQKDSSNYQILVEGSDNGSGKSKYRLYAKAGANQFAYVNEFAVDSSIIFQGLGAQSYEFFTIAIDSVGLRETMKVEGVDPEIVSTQDVPTTQKEQRENPLTILNAYPVPAKESLTIDYYTTSEAVVVKMYNLTGQAVFRQHFKSHPKQMNSVQLDIARLSAGAYVVVIESREGQASRSVVRIE